MKERYNVLSDDIINKGECMEYTEAQLVELYSSKEYGQDDVNLMYNMAKISGSRFNKGVIQEFSDTELYTLVTDVNHVIYILNDDRVTPKDLQETQITLDTEKYTDKFIYLDTIIDIMESYKLDKKLVNAPYVGYMGFDRHVIKHFTAELNKTFKYIEYKDKQKSKFCQDILTNFNSWLEQLNTLSGPGIHHLNNFCKGLIDGFNNKKLTSILEDKAQIVTMEYKTPLIIPSLSFSAYQYSDVGFVKITENHELYKTIQKFKEAGVLKGLSKFYMATPYGVMLVYINAHAPIYFGCFQSNI